MSSPSSQGGPGPSTTSQKQKRIQATRSHSSPSLTHWIGTPEGGMKRSWIPSTSPGVAITCVEDKKGVGKVDKGKGRDAGVEEGLSQLYVTHERQEISSTSCTSNARRRSPIKKIIVIQSNDPQLEPELEPIPNEDGNASTDEVPKAQTQRNSWGSSLVGSVVTAGVFGAALGLTAYRLLANQPQPKVGNDEDNREAQLDQNSVQNCVEIEIETSSSEEVQVPSNEEESLQNRSTLANAILHREDTEDEEEIDQTTQDQTQQQHQYSSDTDAPEHVGPSSLLSKHDDQDQIAQDPISDLPPPPAYEETVQRDAKVKEWEDVEIDNHLVTPSAKVSALRPKASSMFLSPSSSPSPKSRRNRPARVRRSRSSRNGWICNHPLSDSRSLPSIEIYHPTLDDEDIESTFSGSPDVKVKTSVKSPSTDVSPDNEGDFKLLRDRSDDVNGQKEECEADDEQSNAMISRLDSMSLQLTALIEEGKKALESTPGLGTTPIWEEEGDLFTPSPKDRKNVGDDELRESSRERNVSHRKMRRESKIPMRIGSDMHLRQSSSSTMLDSDERNTSRKIGSSSEVERLQREVSKSKIPIMSKSRSMVSGLNGV
ncbi:hypothetical protein V865_005056 [Kwoniella europaea PYCC6329]|uniref:Uncharacterized protein n=1 Tax=Kwoniella europaea PYCC6329 TaxID=1423913 RepID=A0AAX4KLY2_9TREE